ncbi:MAG: tRNA lysidine(34) synthetase TilS [Steroidobacteraceae bacterium]
MSSRHAFDPRWLTSQLKSLLPEVAVPRYCVAFSGGLDSTVLLAALAAAHHVNRRRVGFELRAVHVEHGLHELSPHWSAHCRRFARALGVPIEVLRVKVCKQRGESLEAQARTARYGLLGRSLQSGEILLTAQHLDDQLETVLLQLLRGAGVAGLAAMPAVAPFGSGMLLRPLLERPRAALLQWAQDMKLQWIEDPSNLDTGFDRNFLRLRVLPVVRERWPAAAAAVARSARHAAEAQRLLDGIARRDVGRAADGAALEVQALRALEPGRRINALRFWIVQQGVESPATRRLQEIAGPMLAARRDANPQLRWGNVVLRREQGHLRLDPVAPPDAPKPRTWRPARQRRVVLAHGVLELQADAHGTLDLDALPSQLRVLARSGNESGALKKILQAVRVAPSERGALPLVYHGAQLLAVADRWLHPVLRAGAASARRARLLWKPVL